MTIRKQGQQRESRKGVRQINGRGADTERNGLLAEAKRRVLECCGMLGAEKRPTDGKCKHQSSQSVVSARSALPHHGKTSLSSGHEVVSVINLSSMRSMNGWLYSSWHP